MPRFIDSLKIYILMSRGGGGNPIAGRKNAIFVSSTKHSVKMHTKHSTLLWDVDYKRSPFFLRDSGGNETPVRVKNTPREMGETRRRQRKMRDYRQSPSF